MQAIHLISGYCVHYQSQASIIPVPVKVVNVTGHLEALEGCGCLEVHSDGNLLSCGP
jgi:hypothetical protein